MTVALLDLPHHRARALLSGGMPVYLCINPVEYHGPHLSLHNDRLLSLGAMQALGERLQARHDWPIVLADHLEVGVDPCPGPGSRAVSFGEVRSLVRRSCEALASLGAQRVVLMTFHGAPLHNMAIEAGAAWLREQGIHAFAPFHLVLQQMLAMDDGGEHAEATDTVADPEQRAAVARALPRDFHAGFFETSLALCWAGDSVSEAHRELPPCPEITPDGGLMRLAGALQALGRRQAAHELRFAALALGWQRLRPFPGYTSRPAVANPEAGAIFAARILELYEAHAEPVLLGGAAPPRPVMEWTRWSTGGGRWPPHPELSAADVVR